MSRAPGGCDASSGDDPREPVPPHERRRHPRVRLDAPSGFQLEQDGPIRGARTRDCSESGAFVATRTPPPPGAWICLRLLLDGAIFHVDALVLRVVTEHDRGAEPGFAAAFVGLPDGARRTITRLATPYAREVRNWLEPTLRVGGK